MNTSVELETSGRYHLDNRLIHSIGRAALDLGLRGPKVRLVSGIPLRVTGKSPFFDHPA